MNLSRQLILGYRAFLLLAFCVRGFLALASLGCSARLTVLPEVAQYPEPAQVLIRGKIIYEGKQEYLPGTVGEGGNTDTKLLIKYTLDESHSREDYVLLNAGGYAVGPKGWNIVGTLEIMDGDKVIRKFISVAFAKGPGQFGDTLTELRRKALMAVRGNIEAQMFKDAEALQRLVNETH